MMYDIDRFYRPLAFNTENHKVVVYEDPNGSNDKVVASLPLNIDGTYYGVSKSDPTDTTLGSSETVSTLSDLEVVPLYGHLARALTAASANGYTYQCSAATPSNSEHTNSGLTIFSTGTFKIGFSSTDFTLNPRYLGYGRGRSSDTGAATAFTGPYSRWADWQSPKIAHDKRKRLNRNEFRSSDGPGATVWQWGQLSRLRKHVYLTVPSPHVYAFDRASRQDLADLAGLPKGDANNNMEDFFRLARAHEEQRIIAHENEGESDLSLSPNTKTHNVGYLHKQPTFHPSDDTEYAYANEHYDVRFVVALEPPEKYIGDEGYRH